MFMTMVSLFAWEQGNAVSGVKGRGVELQRQIEEVSAHVRSIEDELAKRDRKIEELEGLYGALRRDLYTEWAKGVKPR